MNHAGLLERLEDVRARFVEAGDEAGEDLVLELMDYVCGWCSPDARLESDS